MRIVPIKSINRYASENAEHFINTSEEEYRYQIEYVVNGIIAEKSEKPIILLSGPSGSGKTISSHRIQHMLEQNNYHTHLISMDNYFLPVSDNRNECDNNGKIDFESPKRLDIDLFNTQLDMIWRGEEVILPQFDFAIQSRKQGKPFKRNKNDLVIIEGIHSLNPLVTGDISHKASTVYASVRTRLRAADKKLLHPSKIRLMRRLVRDKLFRGRPFLETIEFFENVERGEKLYIMPYKHLAQYDIDTFLPFETCVYKEFLVGELENLLKKNDFNDEYFLKIKELFNFLKELTSIDAALVSSKSLVREFIGGNDLMN